MFRKKDPVCGKKVWKQKSYSYKYKGKIYYFDCQACRSTFKDDPERFFKRSFGKKMLNWLSKGSDKVPKSCHDK